MNAVNMKIVAALLALSAAGFLGYVAKIYWCSMRLEVPIFESGELSGRIDRVVQRLGSPDAIFYMTSRGLRSRASLRDLFLPSDLSPIGEREITVHIWEQRCLGSTIWRMAVIVDAKNQEILAVGGETSSHTPVYFGGG